MVKTICPRISVEKFSFNHTLADHVFGDLFVIGTLFLFLLALHANRCMVIH